MICCTTTRAWAPSLLLVILGGWQRADAGENPLIFRDGFETPAGQGLALTSNWHPDADGDGVASENDLCPTVYDPGQEDVDADQLGNACDPDFAPPVEGGPITDLRVEHVTPYGAWFSFTSPNTTTFGWDAVIAWSTDGTDLATDAEIQTALDRGDGIRLDVNEDLGEALGLPAIVTSLEPETTYHAVAVRQFFNGLDSQLGNRVTFTTQAAPAPQPGAQYPRVWLTPSHLASLQNRSQANDSAYLRWRTELSNRVLQAAADPDNFFGARNLCAGAAHLWLIEETDDFRQAAMTLFDRQLQHWQGGVFQGGNDYRNANALLGRCLDLLWEELDPTTRVAAVEALLLQAEGRPSLRLGDTDETAAEARGFVADGLVACNADGLDSALNDRACSVLDAGLRLFYGIQLVKARREQGMFAQSGAYLPDGTRYAIGTFGYWLETYQVLENAGVDMTPWMPFVQNNFRSMKLHALTPSGAGYTTVSDQESFEFFFDVEPNSFPKTLGDANPMALLFGLLDNAGLTDDARRVRALMYRNFIEPDIVRVGDNLLLFDTDEIGRIPLSNEPTSFFASGFGVLHARTSWAADARLMMFRGGWGAVDHVHADFGHFQFYRAGRWLINEALGTLGIAGTAAGHNVLALEIPDDDTSFLGQYNFESARTQRVMGATEASTQISVLADATGAYRSPQHSPFWYESAHRALLWLRDDGAHDLIAIRDFVRKNDNAPAAPDNAWALHIYDELPAIAENVATVTFPEAPGGAQQARVVFLGASPALSIAPSEGEPESFPSTLYNNRLLAEAQWANDAYSMLALFSAADDGTQLPAVTDFSAGGWLAAAIGSRAVVFPEGAPGDPLATASLTLPAAVAKLWIGGLAPDSTIAVTIDNASLTVGPGTDFRADASGLVALAVSELGIERL